MEVSKDTVLRAWKDEGFRKSLSDEEQAAIPPRPIGENGRELGDEQLEAAAGGVTPALVVGGLGLGLAAEEAWD